jgi:hypothetical protein
MNTTNNNTPAQQQEVHGQNHTFCFVVQHFSSSNSCSPVNPAAATAAAGIV